MEGNHLIRRAIVLVFCMPAFVLYAQTSLFVDGTSSIYIKSLTISAKGHVTNNGTIDANSTGILTLNGTTLQNLDGTASNTTGFGRINISNTAGVNLGTNVTISAATGLDFTTGPLTLNNASARFAVGSGWTSNNTTTKFFVTNGLGLVYAYNNGAAVTYPIGTALGAATYKPFVLTNTGTAGTFGVRVQSDYRTNYNSANGAPLGFANVTDAVALTWIIDKTGGGASNLTVAAQWRSTDEIGGFARASSTICYFNYATSTWTLGTIGAATGANPYTRTLAISPSNLAFLPLTVGGALSPFPITLLDFNAMRAGNDVLLNWSTATETNNDYFEMERSTNAVNFEKLAVVKGAGNSAINRNYSLTDLSASEIAAGKPLYYRFKQVDFDGRYVYSPIRFVRFDNTENNGLKLYPNPTPSYLTVVYPSEHDCNITISVVNVLGVTVKQLTKAVYTGENTVLLDLNELENATYSIVIQTPFNLLVRKIVLSK
jgi:hypothetical protein